jgi:hypothetical protein
LRRENAGTPTHEKLVGTERAGSWDTVDEKEKKSERKKQQKNKNDDGRFEGVFLLKMQMSL